MIPFQTYEKDQSPESPIQRIISGALGKPIILSAAATTANKLVPEGECGYYSSKLYFTISGTTYSISLTTV